MSKQKHTCTECGSNLYFINQGIDVEIKTDKFCTADLYKCERCGRLSYIFNIK